MKEVKAFKCDFCSKLYQKERFASAHELKCTSNPANKTVCFGCDHLEKVTAEHTYFDHNGNDYQEEVHIMKCSKIGVYVYPPKVGFSERGPYLAENLGDVENIPMKKECNLFEEQNIII